MADKPTVGAGDTALERPLANDGAGGDDFRPGRSRWIVPLITALALLVPLLLVAIVKLYGPQIERDAYTSLEIAARLKAQQVESWLAERHSDGRVIAADTELLERIAAIGRGADPRTAGLVRQRLEHLKQAYGYSAVHLLDPRGEPLLVLGGQHDLSAQTTAMLPGVFASGEVTQSDFYLGANDGLASLNFVVPLTRATADGPQSVAALVLHTEPDTSIFPLILAWPSASPSGETLLVRADGHSVVYLNQLRHVKDAALKLKRPLADPLLPAAIAIRAGAAGTIRGRDHRDVEVLAAYRPVAGTDWHLVAKLDVEEVMAPLWKLVTWVGLVSLAAIVTVGAMLRQFWLQQDRLHRLSLRARQAKDLRESEARFRAVTETAHDAIVTADANGYIVGWNPSATRMFGFDASEALGKPLAQLIPPRFRQRAIDGFFRMLDGDPEHKDRTVAELIGLRKDNSECLLEHSVALWETAAGRFYTCTLRDITLRKQQEEHTRQLLVENQTMLRNALVGIVYLKQERIASCNRRFEELFNYDPGEMIGKSSALLYDRHETFLDIGRHAYAALGEARNYSAEVLLRHKDDSLFWGALNGCAIDPAHPDEGSIWIYADISERRRAEQESGKLLQAVEQSPVSIIITGRDGLIEYVNPSFTRTTGYSREDALGRNPGFLKSEFTPLETFRDLWRTILAGETWRGVLRNRCKDGTLIWEETAISPIFNADGETTHFVAVKEDVTQRKRIEQELTEHRSHLEDLVARRTSELSSALKAAQLADRTKDEFLANITHELRTPLSAVIGFSSLARPFCTDERQRSYLDKVNSAGKTLSGIIDDLLDLSKIAAGRMGVEAAAFSLRQLVARSHSVGSYKAHEKGLQLIEWIDDSIPDVLIGDSLRLEQILLNLLSNAVKFTTAGRVELRVGVHAREAQRICLDIEVEDTGMGMSEEEIALLFKPFSQADASITRQFGGTGLGLAICKRLAELMDGEISVSSREGRGSTFRVLLWLGVGAADDLPPTPDSREAARVSYRDARVLVVDDQPFNRDVVEGLLAVVGISPCLADNGQEAVDILASDADAFDLVLMDIQMPVMDGLTATRVIRKLDRFADLPIVAMTAHTMAHERENAIAAGMNDHIGKPFDEANFYRVLAKWIPRDKQHGHAAKTGRTPTNDFPPLRGVDTRAGLALLLGDEERYRYWLNDFINEAPVAIAAIRRALDSAQPEPASMAAHTLKGRMGLLGMRELHALAATLEAAIDAAEATDAALLGLEQGVAAMCNEIQSRLGRMESPAPATLPEFPPGVVPAAVTQLLAGLRAGDADSDLLAADCLAELGNTAWAPRLRQVLRHVQNFDYAAAARLLENHEQDRAQGD